MKKLKAFLNRLTRRDKRGSSLGLVVIIGAALVIWVMGIMPLMTTTGTQAIQTQLGYTQYLASRSAIEFAKSELQRIVEEISPYTFAVVKNDDGTYEAIPKYNGVTLNTNYSDLIDAQTINRTDDFKDTPKTVAGDRVEAICACCQKNDGTYEILITTFHKGEKGLTYTVQYTPNGSLLIHPEAYEGNAALPLSDFVVVDGKLGAETIWDSTIDWNTAEGGEEFYNATTKQWTFEEYLLPYKANTDGTYTSAYASSRDYPAVFKTTALAATTTQESLSPLTDGFTEQTWILPQTADKNADGYLNLTQMDGKYQLTIRLGGETVDVADFTVYANGKELDDKKEPTGYGLYTITLDYPGTGNYDAGKTYNVLPITGVGMGDGGADITTQKQNAPTAKLYSLAYTARVIKDGKVTEAGKIEVSFERTKDVDSSRNDTSTVQYGYCTASEIAAAKKENKEKNEIPMHWVASSSTAYATGIELPIYNEADEEETYYFYCYKPAYYSNGVVYEKSAVSFICTLYPWKSVSVDELESGREYLIRGSSDSNYAYTYTNRSDISLGSNAIFTGDNDGQIVGNKGILSKIPDKAYLWTVTKDGNNIGTLKNGSGYYLSLVGGCDSFIGYHYDWNLKVSLSASGKEIKYSDGRENKICVQTEYSCSCTINNQGKISVYWNGNSSASKNSTPLYFIPIPDAAPAVEYIPVPSHDNVNTTYTGTESLPTDVTIYYNGETNQPKNPGVYDLVAVVSSTNTQPGYAYHLGKLIIEKESVAVTPTLTASTSGFDVTLEVSGWGDTDKVGSRYLAYQKVKDSMGDEVTDTLHYFPLTEETMTLTLPYGTYRFTLLASGTWQYDAQIAFEAQDVPVTPPSLKLAGYLVQDMFQYSINSDDNSPVWYKLPEACPIADSSETVKLTPGMVQLVYGVPTGNYDENGVTIPSWQKEYTPDVRYYGVIIPGSEYKDLDSVFRLPAVVNVTYNNGHTTSVINGKSLYFMGEERSLNPFGNTIYLKADLLVLGSTFADDTGKVDGDIVVDSFTAGKDVLLFISTKNNIVFQNAFGIVTLQARHFYRLPSGTSLKNLTQQKLDTTYDENNPQAGYHAGSSTSETVKTWLRYKAFPDVNVDIAYATPAQLARIVSGETIGWTVDGVLKGSDDFDPNGRTDNTLVKRNIKYVVCAYADSVEGDVKRIANRVMLAADTLTIPGNVDIYTRYLSLDLETISKNNNGSHFKVHNVATKNIFLQALGVLELYKYNTNSLQLDIEQANVTIDNRTYSKTIRRIKDGFDFFNGTDVPEDTLMVTYTTDDISKTDNWLFNNAASIKTTDRYITVSEATLDATAFNKSIWIYSNYIYFPNLTEIKMTREVAGLGTRFCINSQESGYTTNEYMGLFNQHTAENYNGTLVYFGKDVIIKNGTFIIKEYEIPKGFYFIKAKPADQNGSGRSITELCSAKELTSEDLSKEENKDATVWKVPIEELANYSIYIDENGNLSNSYVDTGLFGNNTIGGGNFTGGNTQ